MKTNIAILQFSFVGVLAFASIWIFKNLSGQVPYSAKWEAGEGKITADMRADLEPHFATAQNQANAAIANRAAEFAEFIKSRRSGAKPFSVEMISWGGKWRAIKPYIPFTGDDSHEEYVAEKFAKHIFSESEISTQVKRAIEAGVRDLTEIENGLAVAIRQELLGKSLPPDVAPVAAMEFSKAIDRMVEASQWDAKKTAGALVVSEVASQVARLVFIRLGVSTGILTTGAANSWWSFGGAIVVGLIADIVWEWIDDPAGDIERDLVEALDSLAEEGSEAITEEMGKIVSGRSVFWRRHIDNILP